MRMSIASEPGFYEMNSLLWRRAVVRLAALAVAVAVAMLASGAAYAEEEKPGESAQLMKLWPGEVPLQQAGELPPERWEKWGLVDIHEPTMTYYAADKAKATGMAILIMPGGGYGMVCVNHEGHRVAEWFSRQGVAAFVLKYRCRPYAHPVPLMDAQRAMRMIRAGAADYGVDPAKIGVIGFSAGGHLASSLSVHYDMKTREPADAIDAVSARPNFAVLVYPVISMDAAITHRGSRNNLIGGAPDEAMVALMSNDLQVTEATPPTYLVHGDADKGVVPANSERYLEALKTHKVQAELAMVPGAGHGFGLNNNWADACLAWVEKTVK